MKSLRSSLISAFFTLSQVSNVFGIPTPQSGGGVTSKLVAFNAAPAPTVPIGGQGAFVSIDAATKLFNIGGKAQKFAGTNSWWLAYTKANADIDTIFKQMTDSGLLVTRAWGFGNVNDASSAGNIFFQELKAGKQSLNFDSTSGIPKLDYVISAAEKANIKIIIPLLNGNEDLGGINTYVTAYGGDQTSFYTNPAAQKAYLAYVDFIVNRYKSSPAIFSWEICNEPQVTDPKINQCDSNCDTSVITSWAKNVSSHIKSLDSKHLVSLGDEGWFAPSHPAPSGINSYGYGGAKGIDFDANLAIPDIDFGTFHMYPNVFSQADGDAFITEHAKSGVKAGKPVIVEEYGAKTSDKGGRVGIMQGWQATMANATGIAGDMFWQLDYAGSEDGYQIPYSTDAGSDYGKVVLQHVKAVGGNAGGNETEGRN
ncbi:MAG: hypothetical protein Q9220_000400 [cf. Caloplaca sp. 1 TL-2023]